MHETVSLMSSMWCLTSKPSLLNWRKSQHACDIYLQAIVVAPQEILTCASEFHPCSFCYTMCHTVLMTQLTVCGNDYAAGGCCGDVASSNCNLQDIFQLESKVATANRHTTNILTEKQTNIYSPSLITDKFKLVQFKCWISSSVCHVLAKIYLFLCWKAMDKSKSDKFKHWINSSICFGLTSSPHLFPCLFFFSPKRWLFLSHDAVYLIRGLLSGTTGKQLATAANRYQRNSQGFC